MQWACVGGDHEFRATQKSHERAEGERNFNWRLVAGGMD